MKHNKFWRDVLLGVENLLLHKLRSFLTMLGVVFGVGSVVAMLSVGEGASKEALEQIRKVGSNNIIITSMNPRANSRELAQQWNRWNTIPAVTEGRVFVIDSDLVDLPSPRIIDGLEAIAQILHPEIKGISSNQGEGSGLPHDQLPTGRSRTR